MRCLHHRVNVNRCVTNKSKLRKRLLGVSRDESGATAVEFTLIAPVFLYLLMGIIEVSMLFYTSTMVDSAMYDAARLIRTGQVQTSGDALEEFQTSVCNSLANIYNCGDLSIDVRNFSTFSTISFTIEEGDDGDPVYEFDAGGAEDIILARVIYNFQFITPFIGTFFGDDGSGVSYTTTAIFQTEPYE